MLKKLPHILSTVVFLLFSYSLLSAQEKGFEITGKVIDKNTGAPLPNVNIFLSGTMLGCASDEYGNYKITGSLEGNKELVASIIGFQPEVKSVVISSGKKYEIDFKLKQKAYELGTVEIKGTVSEEWQKRLSVFKKYFLGFTDFSNECKIQNEVTIDFAEDKNGNIEATCTEPLIINNQALGYKLICVLMNFSCNDETGNVKYLYYPQFFQLKPADTNDEQKWVSNRKLSYLNSVSRFIKSLINYDYNSNDYNIKCEIPPFELIKYSREDKDYVLAFNKFLHAENRITGDKGWIYLPFHRAVIDKDGFPTNPYSLMTFGSFAEQGIANLLPNSYGSQQ